MKKTIEPQKVIAEMDGLAERLSISKKLVLMLAVPIAGLLVFASIQIAEKLSVVDDMSRLEELTTVAIQASQLAHELQRERGRSANFLAGDARDSAELSGQRARTDEQLSAFRDVLSATQLDGNVRRLADAAIRTTQDLATQRSLVTGRSIEVLDASQYYTGAIDSLLSLVTVIVDNASTASVALSLTSLDALVRMKELAGQERALTVAILTSPENAPVDAAELSRRIGMQDGLAEAFLARGSDESRQAFREKMSANYSEEVNQLREIPIELLAERKDVETAPGEPAATVEPVASRGEESSLANTWWRASSARIDAIFEIEQLMENQLLEEVGALRSSASMALAMYATLAVLCVGAAVLISYLLARGMIRSFTQASETLGRTVSQIAGFVRQQASATSETATAVSQTTTTVEELSRTAQTASSRSSEMTGKAQQSKWASEQALEAVGHGTDAMQLIRSEVEGIAENILELSEKNIQIGEIVQSVNAIAEQSNLLAVNASIEAAKAGEHGKGFSVVAAEVKALAQQSKQATDQIRAILAEIQKSSNGAVMITEQGVKRVEEGANLIEELGRTIRTLGATIEESSDSANQISLIATQQLAGIEQITDAMRNIGVAAGQNAEGARQLEEAAEVIRGVSGRILTIVRGQRLAEPADVQAQG